MLQGHGSTVSLCQERIFFYVEAGVRQGQRGDLIRSGLVRSLGDWAEAEELRLRGQDHIKSDERIGGDSDFQDSIPAMPGPIYDIVKCSLTFLQERDPRSMARPCFEPGQILPQ